MTLPLGLRGTVLLVWLMTGYWSPEGPKTVLGVKGTGPSNVAKRATRSPEGVKDAAIGENDATQIPPTQLQTVLKPTPVFSDTPNNAGRHNEYGHIKTRTKAALQRLWSWHAQWNIPDEYATLDTKYNMIVVSKVYTRPQLCGITLTDGRGEWGGSRCQLIVRRGRPLRVEMKLATEFSPNCEYFLYVRAKYEIGEARVSLKFTRVVREDPEIPTVPPMNGQVSATRAQFSVSPQEVNDDEFKRDIRVIKVEGQTGEENALCGWTIEYRKGTSHWDSNACRMVVDNKQGNWFVEISLQIVDQNNGYVLELTATKSGGRQERKVLPLAFPRVNAGPTVPTNMIRTMPRVLTELATGGEKMQDMTLTTRGPEVNVRTTIEATKSPSIVVKTEKSQVKPTISTRVTAEKPATPTKTHGPEMNPNPTTAVLTTTNKEEEDSDDEAGLDVMFKGWGSGFTDELWEAARHNGWYKWALFAAKEMQSDECILCTESPLSLPTVVPEKYTFEGCARYQRERCKKGQVSADLLKQSPMFKNIFRLPVCGFMCRLLYGSRRSHRYLGRCPACKTDGACAEFRVLTTQAEPPVDYKVDYSQDYECFTSGGFSNDTRGVFVGNTTVRCNVTWVLSWFPESNNAKPFIHDPAEDEVSVTMTTPMLHLFFEQSNGVADSYWMCGGNRLRNVLPSRWIGLCTLVRLRIPVVLTYEGVREVLGTDHAPLVGRRSKRQYSPVQEIKLGALGLPTGIPEEFKAQNEVRAGLRSLLPWLQIHANVKWINYLYFSSQRYLNVTYELFRTVGDQLHATSTMAWQNRQALDWLLAERGGVCSQFGDYCCTYIPNNTAHEGAFSVAMRKLEQLGAELKENAGKGGDLSLDWLDKILGKWSLLAKAAVSAVIVLILISCLACCIVPILRRQEDARPLDGTHGRSHCGAKGDARCDGSVRA